MLRPTQIAIPTLVRVKDGALDRVGIYLSRNRHTKVSVMLSKGIVSPLPERLARSLQEASIETVAWIEVQENDIESATRTFIELPAHVSAVIGMGGGKALEVAKYRMPVCRGVSNDANFFIFLPTMFLPGTHSLSHRAI